MSALRRGYVPPVVSTTEYCEATSVRQSSSSECRSGYVASHLITAVPSPFGSHDSASKRRFSPPNLRSEVARATGPPAASSVGERRLLHALKSQSIPWWLEDA